MKIDMYNKFKNYKKGKVMSSMSDSNSKFFLLGIFIKILILKIFEILWKKRLKFHRRQKNENP